MHLHDEDALVFTVFDHFIVGQVSNGKEVTENKNRRLKYKNMTVKKLVNTHGGWAERSWFWYFFTVLSP